MPEPYVPSAAKAKGPTYTGRAVQDSITYVNYDPALDTALHVPFETQCEILNLIVLAYSGGSIQVFNGGAAAIPAGPVAITGYYGVGPNGNPIYYIAPADATQEPAIALLLTALAAQTAGAANIGGAFTSAIDTTLTAIGTEVYLAAGGGLTLFEPDEDDESLFAQLVGIVQTQATNGIISGFVRPARFVAQKPDEEAAFC